MQHNTWELLLGNPYGRMRMVMDLPALPELKWGRQASESAVIASFLCQATPATAASRGPSCLGKFYLAKFQP